MHRILIPSNVSADLPPLGASLSQFNGLSMGTSWSVSLIARAGMDAQPLQASIQRQLDDVVAQMSHWEADSNLGRFNLASAGTLHPLPENFFNVLAYGITVAQHSGGAYNPLAGALVNCWGFGPHARHDEAGFAIPSADAILAARNKCDWRDLQLDHPTRSVRQPGGALLDFSSIAKGYAVDAVAQYLEAQGIGHYLVELGGELRGAGMKPDGQPWWVELEQPATGQDQPDNAGPIIVALHGLAVATSGDYRRYFHLDGKLFPHTIDPRTGYPIDNGIASVTVLHSQCMAADALSTALTVLGVEAGMEFAQERNIAARFLLRQPDGFTEHTSSAFLDMLE
ncbi:MAG: FAD:protein FMN transferase [Pseudomonadota bacterium]